MWGSQTGQFGSEEMFRLWSEPASTIAARLLRGGDALVALRALAEVMLNGATDKLNELLRNAELAALWQNTAAYRGTDFADNYYYEQLMQRSASL